MKYIVLAKDCEGRVSIIMSQKVFDTQEEAENYAKSCNLYWQCIVVAVPKDWTKSLYA